MATQCKKVDWSPERETTASFCHGLRQDCYIDGQPPVMEKHFKKNCL